MDTDGLYYYLICIISIHLSLISVGLLNRISIFSVRLCTQKPKYMLPRQQTEFTHKIHQNSKV